MDEFIHNETEKHIKKEDQNSFVEDLNEDLSEIGPTRIAGLGITPEQLNIWLKKRKK
jgi:hypothetical protein